MGGEGGKRGRWVVSEGRREKEREMGGEGGRKERWVVREGGEGVVW